MATLTPDGCAACLQERNQRERDDYEQRWQAAYEAGDDYQRKWGKGVRVPEG